MDNKINDWKNKVNQNFNSENAILENIIYTLNNFSHRYLETDLTPQPKIEEISKNILRITSIEGNARNIMNLTDPEIRQLKPAQLKTTLQVELKEIKPERGEIILTAELAWDGKKKTKTKKFVYSDLQEYRKNFPLALEEVCSLFV